jgi:hypothetical protein
MAAGSFRASSFDFDAIAARGDPYLTELGRIWGERTPILSCGPRFSVYLVGKWEVAPGRKLISAPRTRSERETLLMKPQEF